MSDIVSVVIDNGSSTTRAGFSSEQEPSLVFPTAYSKNPTKGDKLIFDDDMYSHPENDIYTIVNEGLVYNWEALEANWEYIFSNLKVNPEELPLIITEELWNNKKNRSKLTELAFEKFKAPVFNILKNPLAISYGLGKSTSLIIDIGGSTTSVTPIVDGTILYKGAVHSKFAGDFLNFHILNYLDKFGDWQSKINGSESFKIFKINDVLTDFKSTINSVSGFPIVNSSADFNITPKHYELPDGSHIQVGKEQVLLVEPLFHPISYKLSNVTIPEGSLGLTDLILAALKKLEVNEEIYSLLLSNIIVTGGGSLLPGIDHRLLSDLSRYVSNFNLAITPISELAERKNAVWQGASVLASMNSFENHYVARDEWLEQGEEIVSEKFK